LCRATPRTDRYPGRPASEPTQAPPPPSTRRSR
jgi:hypothetical protein